MQFGGREVAHAQLRHLAEATEREHVTLLVIPFSAGDFPIAGQSVLYAEGPVPQLDTVHIDTVHGPRLRRLTDAAFQLPDRAGYAGRVRTFSEEVT